MVVAAGCVALCCVLHFDLLGVSHRVPEAGQVEQVEFYAADNTYTLYPGEDADLLEQVRTVHRAIVEDQSYILGYQSDWRYTEKNDVTEAYVRFIYTLNNGRKVERRYSIPLTQERLAQADTYDSLLDQLVNSRTMKAKRLHAGDSRYTVDSGNLWLEMRGDGYDLNSRECAALLDAVARDAASGTWGDYDWFDQNNNSAYAMSLELRFARLEQDHWNYDWISINIRPGMDNTIACLKDLGLVTDKDLVTREQMEKISGWNTSETETYEEKMTQEASLGIIGGADGPTTVVVAGVTA